MMAESTADNLTVAEIARRTGLPGHQWVTWIERRAIRKLWREHVRLARILAGELARPPDGKWRVEG
jgi:transcriptional regulator with XRE-family HTH domain